MVVIGMKWYNPFIHSKVNKYISKVFDSLTFSILSNYMYFFFPLNIKKFRWVQRWSSTKVKAKSQNLESTYIGLIRSPI